MAVSLYKQFVSVCLLLLLRIYCVKAKLNIQDLTHPFDNTTLYWPSIVADKFRFTKHIEVGNGSTYYAMNMFCAAEHGGTHIDAPIHFAEKKRTVGQIPLSHLISKVAIINVTDKAKANRDYLIVEADFTAYEKTHGRIPDESIILLNSGWGKYWPNALEYFGTATSNTSILHFPGLDPTAATWLINQRKIKAIGIDTASIDYGQSKNFDSHRILMAQNIPVFENVANLDKVPEKGAMVYALPMKIGDGTGAPLRIIATWDDDKTSSAISSSASMALILFCTALAMLNM